MCRGPIAASILLALAGSARADWPVFRGDAVMSGAAPAARLPAQLAERWTFKAGDEVAGAPAVSGDKVFVASLDKRLYALDRATGKEKWRAELGPMKASPAVRGGRVIAADVDGQVYAVDAATGKTVWTFATEGEITSGANFHGDNVLVGSHDSTLYCLSPDGKKLWELKIDGPVNGSAAVVGDTTFVAGCDSLLHVVDARTGKDVATVDLGGQAGATAAVAGDQVYVGTMSNQVVGIDWKKAQKLWAFEPARRSQPFYASAAVTDALVVAGARDKKVYALDRATGAEKWSFVTEGQVDASPVIAGGRVYVGALSRGGEFYVLDLATGAKVQEVILDSAVTGSAAVSGDSLFVGTEKGTVYCLGAAK